MPSRKKRLDSERIKAKHEREESKKIPMLIFGLIDENNVRTSVYDSAGPIHRTVMKEVGAVAWLAYNICHLNGRGKEFDRTSMEAKFLLLHAENKSSINSQAMMALNNQIENIKKGNPKIKIFATTKVPIKGDVVKIKKVEEISQYL